MRDNLPSGPNGRSMGPDEIPARSHRLLVSLASAALVLIGAVTVCLVMGTAWCSSRDTGKTVSSGGRLPEGLFPKWPKPDLAIVLAGERHGYLQPCGCSRPQVGGLERLYNLVKLMRDEGWPVAAVDLGDVPQVRGPAGLVNVQGPLKYLYSMKAMERIGFSAVNFGEYEAAQPLAGGIIDLVVTDSEEIKLKIINCNIKPSPDFLDQLAPWKVAETKGSALRMGVTGATGPTVAEAAKKKDPRLQFAEVPDALPRAFKDMEAARPDIKVLLYQGTVAQATLFAKAEKMPKFDIILCLCDGDIAPSRAERVVGNTQIFSVGHKGKSVGIVGVNRTGDAARPFDLHYQLVDLTEEFLTPEDAAKDHPIVAVMEQYTRALKDGDYLKKYPHGSQNSDFPDASYVGSQACKTCHKEAYAVWQKSGHANAYETLEKATMPSLRTFDGECVVCHVVGFSEKSGFLDAGMPAKLKGVGCESCHGPGSTHVKDPYNDDILKKLRSLRLPEVPEESKAKSKQDYDKAVKSYNLAVLRRSDACRRCHDDENDVHWEIDQTAKGLSHLPKWDKIVHSEEKKPKK